MVVAGASRYLEFAPSIYTLLPFLPFRSCVRVQCHEINILLNLVALGARADRIGRDTGDRIGRRLACDLIQIGPITTRS